jgi:hypothetical protein
MKEQNIVSPDIRVMLKQSALAWTGLEGFREKRLSDFKTIGT